VFEDEMGRSSLRVWAASSAPASALFLFVIAIANLFIQRAHLPPRAEWRRYVDEDFDILLTSRGALPRWLAIARRDPDAPPNPR
jgi:hypothetical protein